MKEGCLPEQVKLVQSWGKFGGGWWGGTMGQGKIVDWWSGQIGSGRGQDWKWSIYYILSPFLGLISLNRSMQMCTSNITGAGPGWITAVTGVYPRAKTAKIHPATKIPLQEFFLNSTSPEATPQKTSPLCCSTCLLYPKLSGTTTCWTQFLTILFLYADWGWEWKSLGKGLSATEKKIKLAIGKEVFIKIIADMIRVARAVWSSSCSKLHSNLLFHLRSSQQG